VRLTTAVCMTPGCTSCVRCCAQRMLLVSCSGCKRHTQMMFMSSASHYTRVFHDAAGRAAELIETILAAVQPVQQAPALPPPPSPSPSAASVRSLRSGSAAGSVRWQQSNRVPSASWKLLPETPDVETASQH
jgi:hypothetical protein